MESTTVKTPSDGFGLRWLHLTDLHIGKPHEAQQTAIASMLESINESTAGTSFDLVVFTGDLAYSGKRTEYERLEKLVIEPLRALDQFKASTFVAAPGNHDLDCDVGLPIVWSSLGNSRQSNFFNSDRAGSDIRKSRAEGFREYAEFIKRNDIISVDPSIDIAIPHILEIRGKRLALISLVTALFSDKDLSDERKSVAPVQCLRQLMQGFVENIPTIVLAHHPLTWFTIDSEKHLRSLLIEKGALYINGHEHQISTQFGNRGLVAIGFGAMYQSPLESTPYKFYRNSFAVCELRDYLHLKIVSWDHENGKWRTDTNLPADFSERSEYIADGYMLSLPSTRITTAANRPYAALASSFKPTLEIDACIWLATQSPKRWGEVLAQIGRLREITDTFNLPAQKAATGHYEFRVNDKRGRSLVYVACGSGDILNYDQLQAINTELDMEDYDNCIVATLGSLSEEATTLANRLKSRKPIHVLEREEIVREIVKHSPHNFRAAIADQNPTEVVGTLIITDTSAALLRVDRMSTSWFDVLGEDGTPLQESDQIVLKLRVDLPELRAVRYGGPLEKIHVQHQIPGPVAGFDREAYLEASYAFFDDVKYAPLAALGFRFRKASLSEIYVDASANVNDSSKNTQSIERAVGEFIESLNLPKSQRDQLESQLRSRLGIERTAEVGAARQIYQRYNNVVVLGDPGSGKTCFVKHEILAYCKPPLDGGSWYHQHLPIYVSLAEASRLSDEATGLLDICEILSSRRGIKLPKEEIIKAISAGKAAFFFDGLDEVGFIEKRIKLVGEINDLIRSQARRGNRFVLASRPAAVQPVEIPEGLTYLHLKGLSEAEMRLLAGRVLTIRVGSEESSELSAEENELVDRLLDDTRHSPGIARIARNPLLLTLLVLIYANTGAISAKRHLIYTQAIKTLVSVRGRETRGQQISEADLRTRLGTIAVAIFFREIAEIPRRSEVNKILRPIVAAQIADSLQADSGCNAFLQEVAEATGLLSIHEEGSIRELDLVTFMHYSFLEYYAAAGLLARDYSSLLPGMVGNPRWKDVITLMFGILSEQGDITAATQSLLAASTGPQAITKKALLLCLECAAECDVPPIATQQVLAQAVFETVDTGVGSVSSRVREALAVKMSPFMIAGSSMFDDILVTGLLSTRPLQVAAFIDLVARFSSEVKVSSTVRDALLTHLPTSHTAIAVALLYALERRDDLRSADVSSLLSRALKGSIVEKSGALKVISEVPAYYDKCGVLVERLLSDKNDFVSASAAQCILASGQVLNGQSPVLERLLGKLSVADDENDSRLSHVTLDQEHIDRLLASENKLECELAIRHLPMIKENVEYVYSTLSRIIRTSANPRHKAAALDSFRSAPRATDLITIADTDVICACLDAEERNVRIGALRLMAKLPDDEQIISALQGYIKKLEAIKGRDDELTETARALAKHAEKSPAIRANVLRLVSKSLPTPERGYGDPSAQKHLSALLTICESVSGEQDDVLATRLLRLAEDFKAPESIRKHAMRAFGRVAESSLENVDTLIRLLSRNELKLSLAVYSANLSFVRNCRRKVESIRRVYSKLPELRNILCISWTKEVSTNVEGIDLSGARDIRDSIIVIEEVVVQYGEFAARAGISVQQPLVQVDAFKSK